MPPRESSACRHSMSSGLFWAVLPQVPAPCQNPVILGWPNHVQKLAIPPACQAPQSSGRTSSFCSGYSQSVSYTFSSHPGLVRCLTLIINVSTQHRIRTFTENLGEKLDT